MEPLRLAPGIFDRRGQPGDWLWRDTSLGWPGGSPTRCSANLEAVRPPDPFRRGFPLEGDSVVRTRPLPDTILPSTIYGVSYIR